MRKMSDSPYFVKVMEEHLSGNAGNTINFKTVLEEIFLVLIQRGFNEEEFCLLLKFFSKGCISVENKIQLLPNLVPRSTAPGSAITQFLAWFFINKMKINKKLSVYILQWIIGLLENDLVEINVVDTFYFDLFNMLQYEDFMKYSCKLLCKLTKPADVTSSSVYVVSQLLDKKRSDDKYLHALLNLFKGYKPRLVTEELKRVEITKVLHTVPQKMDKMMKVVMYRQKQILPHKDLGVFEVAVSYQAQSSYQQGLHKASSLIPFPTFNLEGIDKMAMCYPNSLEDTLRKFTRVSVPQNIMSLLRDDTGFALIMYGGVDLQRRFSNSLMQTLQSAFINQDVETIEEDREFLLSRVYDLQQFLQQGLPCVSTFLSGYLLNWDGLDHRPNILHLLEWATFDSFQELSSSILRPLYLMFVSYNVTMKEQIIQTGINLLRNMYAAEVGRVSRELPHPFLNIARAWTAHPVTMLAPMVRWMETLCKVGMCLEPHSSSLLLQTVNFYETINILEFRSKLPIWTMVSAGVVYHSLFKMNPLVLSRVCRLLLVYHKEFLPQLRLLQPQYYSECQDKINISTKYVQELINILWTGQAMSRREDGVVLKQWTDDTLQLVRFPVDLDTSLDLTHNSNFFPHVVREIKKNGHNFLQNKDSFFIMIEHYFKDITDFIKHFAPMLQDC